MAVCKCPAHLLLSGVARKLDAAVMSQSGPEPVSTVSDTCDLVTSALCSAQLDLSASGPTQ